MKKTLIVSLCVIAAICITGCSNKDKDNGKINNVSNHENILNDNEIEEDVSNKDEVEKESNDEFWDAALNQNWDEIVEESYDHTGLTLEQGIKKHFENATVDFSNMEQSSLVRINVINVEGEPVVDMKSGFDAAIKMANDFLIENGVKKVHVVVYDTNNMKLKTSSYELFADEFLWVGDW